MDDNTTKAYQYMKSLFDQNGYAPTVKQTAETLHLKESDVESMINEMQRVGKNCCYRNSGEEYY